MTIFERVKQVTESEGYTLRQVESKAGLSPKSLYNWKTSSPKLENVQKVADVLGVSVDYLLGNTDEKHTQSDKISDADLEAAFEGAESFDGKPMTEHDKQIIKGLIISYLSNKQE